MRNGSVAFTGRVDQRPQRTDHRGTAAGLEAKQDPRELPSPPSGHLGHQLPSKTILVMNVDPDVGPGVPPRARPFDRDASYDFMIDTDGDAVADSAFRITFSNDD